MSFFHNCWLIGSALFRKFVNDIRRIAGILNDSLAIGIILVRIHSYNHRAQKPHREDEYSPPRGGLRQRLLLARFHLKPVPFGSNIYISLCSQVDTPRDTWAHACKRGEHRGEREGARDRSSRTRSTVTREIARFVLDRENYWIAKVTLSQRKKSEVWLREVHCANRSIIARV